MSNYTLTRTEEGRVTFTLCYSEGDPISGKAEALLRELIGVTPKPVTSTDAMRADWDDKVRTAHAKNALDDMRRRALTDHDPKSPAVARNAAAILTADGYGEMVRAALDYSGITDIAAGMAPSSAVAILAYLEVALASYPAPPDPLAVALARH